MMKQRLRMAKQDRLEAQDEEEASAPPLMATSDESSFSQTSWERSSAEKLKRPEKTSNTKGAVSTRTKHFPRSFALTFPEESFDSFPETPVRPGQQESRNEPVWKKRLRHKGKTTTTSSQPNQAIRSRTPILPAKNQPSKRTIMAQQTATSSSSKSKGQTVVGGERVKGNEREEPRSHSTRQPDEAHSSSGDSSLDAQVETGVNLHKPKQVIKTVSFDEAGIRASQRSRKKNASRSRKKERYLDTTLEEESFDEIMKSDSNFSDIFTNLFEDEDFSIATPTIYSYGTDDDGNSSISSHESNEDRPSRSTRHRRRRHRDTDASHHRRRHAHKSKTTDPHASQSWRRGGGGSNNDNDNDEYYAGPVGCQGTAVLEDFKLFTDLFAADHPCICAKPGNEQESSRRNRPKERRSRSCSATVGTRLRSSNRSRPKED